MSCEKTKKQMRDNALGNLVQCIAEPTDPPSVIAGTIVVALSVGATYEQMADATRWPAEKLKAIRDADPGKSAATYTYTCDEPIA